MYLLKKIFNCSFLILFYVVALIGITTVVQDCFCAGIIAFALMLLFAYFTLRGSRMEPLKPKKNLWLYLQLASTGITLCFAFWLSVCFSWDWGQLIKTAYEITMGEEISLIEYYARYPNNRFWLTVLTGLFKLIRVFVKNPSRVLCKHVSVVFSVAFVQLTILVIYKTAQRIWSAEKAFMVGCAALLFLPFYLYSQFCYTDTPGMLMIACTAYLYIRYKENGGDKIKGYVIAAGIGVLSALIYQTKIMGMIVTVAIIIDVLLSMNSAQMVKKGIISLTAVALTFVCCVGLTNAITNKVVPVSDELSQQYEFPYTHWVMMGLGKSGGYTQPDVDYSSFFSSYDLKVEANVLEISNRLAERGVHGTFKHLVVTKVARTWGNDDFAGSDYIHRWPVRQGSWMHDVFLMDGEKEYIREIYTSIYHIFMLSGILIAAGFAIKSKKDDPLLFARIALFGMIIFMMIWECNSRYLLILSSLLLLCGCDGWFRCIHYLRKKPFKRS